MAIHKSTRIYRLMSVAFGGMVISLAVGGNVALLISLFCLGAMMWLSAGLTRE